MIELGAPLTRRARMSKTSPETSAPGQQDDIWLVYDGDCPFCATAAKMYRIKQAVGALHIVDAREAAGTPLMNEIAARGFNLNQGIAVKLSGQLYHGVDALNLLAMIGSSHGWLNRLNVTLFRSKAVTRFCYPAMKAVRNMALWCLGKKPI